ncbi:protein EI24 homolog isoform X1 [Zingiber officinale]|uniref:protein EI24 homolog isoform X1 n=3 Tax=Zingiber officinale TaxID=94328 RepID=UPI001C4AE293|nr:protein EI24 homolog isoform X1 [Zingiber officinale]
MPLAMDAAGFLWLAGFKEACSLRRVAIFCSRSRILLIRTGQCFLLNGFIFLGSLFILKSVVIPTLLWILPDQYEQFNAEHLYDHKAVMPFYALLRSILIELVYIFWFYPLYIFSFVLSTLWYNDIAKHAFEVLKSKESTTQAYGKNELTESQSISTTEIPGGFEGVCLGIGEQIYSILLLTLFFIEVFATGFIPYFGKAINFLLLSWMYAYYCFEYKWNYSNVALNRRLDFFESNWPFFAGFGSPCVIPIFFFSPLVSYGVMAILYPLFVLTAAGTQSEQVISSIRSFKGGPKKLPIFYAANKIAMSILQLLPEPSKTS